MGIQVLVLLWVLELLELLQFWLDVLCAAAAVVLFVCVFAYGEERKHKATTQLASLQKM